MVNPVVCTVGFSGYLLLSMIVGVLAGLYVQILDSGDVSGVRVNAALPCLLDESEPPPPLLASVRTLLFSCVLHPYKEKFYRSYAIVGSQSLIYMLKLHNI